MLYYFSSHFWDFFFFSMDFFSTQHDYLSWLGLLDDREVWKGCTFDSAKPRSSEITNGREGKHKLELN